MRVGSFQCGYPKAKALMIKTKAKDKMLIHRKKYRQGKEKGWHPRIYIVFGGKRQFPFSLPLNWMRGKKRKIEI